MKMARILIVDDALIMRKTLGKIVEDGGHSVVAEAVNGEEAILMYQKYLPDVVTMDITMPETDGIQALTRIREYDEHAKVIMVSALGQQHKVMEALDQGAKSYILKPIAKEKILAVLKQVTEVEDGALVPSGQGFIECGEERNQKSCDAAFLPFTLENTEGTFSFTLKDEFGYEDFPKLMTAVQEILLLNPMEIVFNFIHSNVLNNKVVNSCIEIMTAIIDKGSKLQIICYSQDYMNCFRNVSILKKVDFALIKKI